MKSDGSKSIKNGAGFSYTQGIGGNTPPQSKVLLLPKNMNKSFFYRFKEWLK